MRQQKQQKDSDIHVVGYLLALMTFEPFEIYAMSILHFQVALESICSNLLFKSKKIFLLANVMEPAFLLLEIVLSCICSNLLANEIACFHALTAKREPKLCSLLTKLKLAQLWFRSQPTAGLSFF